MKKVTLIHWNRSESELRAEKLRKLGYGVEHFNFDSGPAALRALRDRPPDAFVIDLSRLPSHGRAVAVALRQQSATRGTPILFVDGAAEKVRALQDHLPDATFSTWRAIRTALRRAIENPPSKPVVPGTMDAYSKTPLPKKLGIKPGTTLLLLGAPDSFEDLLGEDAAAANIRRDSRGLADLVILFSPSLAYLEKKLPTAERSLKENATLWIAWPKKTSGLQTDLSERDVRAIGLARGLVDFKICAIDDTWSGLRFARKRRA